MHLPLIREQISPGLERIRPVWPALARLFELRLSGAEIAVAGEGDSPGVIRAGQIWRQCDRLCILSLRPRPVATAGEDVGAKPIAVDESARRQEYRVR